MACKCAPALTALRREMDLAFPNRDKASDGCCASSQHTAQNPTSDHEPRSAGPAVGYAVALDLDEDLTPNGPGPDDLVGLLFQLYGTSEATAAKRVRYLIYEGFIYYLHDGKRARGKYVYTGSNPHDKHLHISIFEWAFDDTSPWLTAPQEDDLTPEQAKQLQDIHKVLCDPNDGQFIDKRVQKIGGELRDTIVAAVRRLAGFLNLPTRPGDPNGV